jgi:hypothetical protein
MNRLKRKACGKMFPLIQAKRGEKNNQPLKFLCGDGKRG